MEAITLLATVPAILALVNLGKKFGIKQQHATALAVVLGVVINVANFYLGEAAAYQAAIQGLILGLSAAGVYDTAKIVGSSASAEK